jgi:type III restriction enzyme
MEQARLTIPYTMRGQPKSFMPDIIVRIDDGRGPDDLLNLIVELSSIPSKKNKQVKVDTAKSLLVPAVNSHGWFGWYAFLEITDIDSGKTAIKTLISGANQLPGPHR